MKRLAYGITCAAALLIGPGCDLTKADRAEDGTVRVADIQDHPENFAGKTVTVVADVEEEHSPRAFSLDEDPPSAGGLDNDLMVLYPQSDTLRDIDDQWLNNKVRVTGTVGTVNVVEIEREIGWDLSPELEVEVGKAKAVIIAKTVERVE